MDGAVFSTTADVSAFLARLASPFAVVLYTQVAAVSGDSRRFGLQQWGGGPTRSPTIARRVKSASRAARIASEPPPTSTIQVFDAA